MEKYKSFELKKVYESQIDEGNRLEEEPTLFTREEVVEHMTKAITLYGITGKEPKKSELYSLLSK